MPRPLLAPGIVERGNLPRLWVNGSQIRAFIAVTGCTSPGEIVQCGSPAMFLCNDMIWLVRKKGIFIGDEAIFAAPLALSRT